MCEIACFIVYNNRKYLALAMALLYLNKWSFLHCDVRRIICISNKIEYLDKRQWQNVYQTCHIVIVKWCFNVITAFIHQEGKNGTSNGQIFSSQSWWSDILKIVFSVVRNKIYRISPQRPNFTVYFEHVFEYINIWIRNELEMNPVNSLYKILRICTIFSHTVILCD